MNFGQVVDAGIPPAEPQRRAGAVESPGNLVSRKISICIPIGLVVVIVGIRIEQFGPSPHPDKLSKGSLLRFLSPAISEAMPIVQVSTGIIEPA